MKIKLQIINNNQITIKIKIKNDGNERKKNAIELPLEMCGFLILLAPPVEHSGTCSSNIYSPFYRWQSLFNVSYLFILHTHA